MTAHHRTPARLRATLLLLVATLAALAFAGCSREAPPAPGGLTLAAPPKGGDFTLQTADGPLASQHYRGKVIALYFGYTYCPDVCPTSLAALGEALALLTPAELAQVQPLFISVDPERDALPRLKEYAAFFHPRMIGATGSPAEVAAVAGAYGASYARQDIKSEGGYVVDHSSFVYLIAPDGRLAASLPHGSTPEAIAAALRQLLPPAR